MDWINVQILVGFWVLACFALALEVIKQKRTLDDNILALNHQIVFLQEANHRLEDRLRNIQSRDPAAGA